MALDLESCLQQSSALHAELDQLWSGLTLPQSKRGQVVVGFCSIVREHVLSQHHLLAIGHHVTALTLVRPSYEALVRAIWCFHGASDGWIEKFLTPPEPDTDLRKETHTGPPVESMLDTIAKQHPEWVHRSLVELKEATWQPMHSYVHGGIRPVLQALLGFPDSKQVSVLRNSNGFWISATDVMRMVSNGRTGLLPPIQSHFAECLPPASGGDCRV
jgi:uncharacterized protein DUF6988